MPVGRPPDDAQTSWPEITTFSFWSVRVGGGDKNRSGALLQKQTLENCASQRHVDHHHQCRRRIRYGPAPRARSAIHLPVLPVPLRARRLPLRLPLQRARRVHGGGVRVRRRVSLRAAVCRLQPQKRRSRDERVRLRLATPETRPTRRRRRRGTGSNTRSATRHSRAFAARAVVAQAIAIAPVITACAAFTLCRASARALVRSRAAVATASGAASAGRAIASNATTLCAAPTVTAATALPAIWHAASVVANDARATAVSLAGAAGTSLVVKCFSSLDSQSDFVCHRLVAALRAPRLAHC